MGRCDAWCGGRRGGAAPRDGMRTADHVAACCLWAMEEALNLDSLLAEAGVTTLLTDCVASALPLTSFTLTLCMVFCSFSSSANASDLQSARRLSVVAQRFAHSLDTHFAIHASLPAAPLSSPPATCGPSLPLFSHLQTLPCSPRSPSDLRTRACRSTRPLS